MTPTPDSLQEERREQAHKFITRLLAYQPDKESKDRQALAELRGLLHNQPRDYLRAGKYVFPYLPAPLGTQQSNDDFIEQCFFQVGALYAWGQGGITQRNGVSLGGALRKLRQSGSNSDSLDIRLFGLLNSPSDTFFTHLRQLIGLLRSASSKDARTELDWEMLLIHALDWNMEKKPVQRLWARHFYRDPKSSAPSDEADHASDDNDNSDTEA